MGGLRQFLLSASKSAGRNSSGRITIFHRGGGAKRLQRKVDLKRSTSSMGIVERVEYDPNRSSRIALVRWIEEVDQRKLSTIEESPPPPPMAQDPITTTIRGVFSFSSMPGMVGQRKIDTLSPGSTAAYAVVGPQARVTPSSKGEGNKKTRANDVFFSAFSSSTEADTPFGLPRIAIAGAKPAIFAPRMREDKLEEKNTFSLDEVRKWRKDSDVWANRIKSKAAVSWSSELKLKKDQGRLPTAKPIGEKPKDRAAVTYIIASHELETGKMVMNCDWSKSKTSQNPHSYY